MRLDVNSLSVQTFSASPRVNVSLPSDTGRFGPDSECYICYETGNTVPSCMGYECDQPQTDPDTAFYPCTNRLTCVGCA